MSAPPPLPLFLTGNKGAILKSFVVFVCHPVAIDCNCTGTLGGNWIACTRVRLLLLQWHRQQQCLFPNACQKLISTDPQSLLGTRLYFVCHYLFFPNLFWGCRLYKSHPQICHKLPFGHCGSLGLCQANFFIILSTGTLQKEQ